MNIRVISLAAAVALAACSPQRHAPRHHYKQSAEKVYHLSDGRYGYQDDSGLWWFIIASSNGGLPTSGSWSQGSAPSSSDLEAATVSEAAISVSETGSPATAAEVSAETSSMGDGGPAPSEGTSMGDGGPAPSSDGGSSGGDSGGGDAGGGGSSE